MIKLLGLYTIAVNVISRFLAAFERYSEAFKDPFDVDFDLDAD
jgi:hypothetical protein